ncbi:MAG: hypothetical protein KKG99_04890 [Bacteroidetes bacterium]|nr:hypothetical protein [Bacteroidota bacterium]
MALIHSCEKNGNTLFKYCGQIPVLLFLFAVPIIHFTDYGFLTVQQYKIFTYTAIGISVFGFLIRAYAIGATPKGTSGRDTREQIAETLNITGCFALILCSLKHNTNFLNEEGRS